MKLYITDEEEPSVAIADNIEEAAELLFITKQDEDGKDEIKSITSSDDYYRVEVMHSVYGYGSWTTTELVNEHELENHTVYR